MKTADMALEDKAATAVMEYLAARPALKGVEITTELTDAIKKDGTMVVSAYRTGLVGGQGSGVYAMNITVEFKMIRKRGRQSASAFQQRAADVLAAFDRKNPFVLCQDITKAFNGEFHCYFAQLNGTDRLPFEDEHRLSASIALEAMGISYATGLQNNRVDRQP